MRQPVESRNYSILISFPFPLRLVWLRPTSYTGPSAHGKDGKGIWGCETEWQAGVIQTTHILDLMVHRLILRRFTSHYNPSHSPSSLSRFGTPSGPPSEPNRTERDEDGKDDNVNERSDTVGNGQQHNDPFRWPLRPSHLTSPHSVFHPSFVSWGERNEPTEEVSDESPEETSEGYDSYLLWKEKRKEIWDYESK